MVLMIPGKPWDKHVLGKDNVTRGHTDQHPFSTRDLEISNKHTNTFPPSSA